MDVDTLMELAENALAANNPTAACEFYEVALKMKPHHADVLEAYGEVLLHHCGDPVRARQLLAHSIRSAPDEGYVKYLNLAQLSTGEEALGLYEKGVELLKVQIAKAKKPEDRTDLRRAAATALAATGELFLTDLCELPEAEQRCEELITEAVSMCDECIEAHQSLGSLRLSQCRNEEAKDSLLRAVDLTDALDESAQTAYEAKVELGKLLMQVDVAVAFNFLRSVLELSPGNAYVWFLMGEAARQRKRHPDACRLLKHARVTLSAEENPSALLEIDEAIRVLVEEMGGAAAASAVPHMDDPNPLNHLAPEDDGDEDGASGSEQSDEDA